MEDSEEQGELTKSSLPAGSSEEATHTMKGHYGLEKSP